MQIHFSYCCQVNRSEQESESIRRKRVISEVWNCEDWIKEQCSTEHNGINYSWAFQGQAMLNRCIVLSHQFTLSKFYTFRLFLLWWYLQSKGRPGFRGLSVQMCIVIQSSFWCLFAAVVCSVVSVLCRWAVDTGDRGDGHKNKGALCARSLAAPHTSQVEGHL